MGEITIFINVATEKQMVHFRNFEVPQRLHTKPRHVLNHMRSLNVSCLVGQGKTEKNIRFSGISIAAWMVIFIDRAETNKGATNIATHIQHFFF